MEECSVWFVPNFANRKFELISLNGRINLNEDFRVMGVDSLNGSDVGRLEELQSLLIDDIKGYIIVNSKKPKITSVAEAESLKTGDVVRIFHFTDEERSGVLDDEGNSKPMLYNWFLFL